MVNSIQEGDAGVAPKEATFHFLCSGSKKRQHFGVDYWSLQKTRFLPTHALSHVSPEIMVRIYGGVFLFLFRRCPLELDGRETMIAHIGSHAVESSRR